MHTSQKAALPLGAKILLVAVLGLTGCETRIQHGLPEHEANRILDVLGRSGVEATKVQEKGRSRKFAICVPRGQESRAIEVLQHHELPRRARPGFGEVFGKSSLVPTALEQQARYLHALSGELSRTLETADGVLEARVHLVLPRRDPLALGDRPPPKPRAAVLLRVQPKRKTLSRDEVRRLVAGSVDHLDPQQIAVVIRPAHKPALRPTSAGLAHVGPISVAAASRPILKWLLGGGLALVLVLGGGIVLLTMRLGRLRRELAVRPAGPESEIAPGNDIDPQTNTGV